jgi:hypothetical protein
MKFENTVGKFSRIKVSGRIKALALAAVAAPVAFALVSQGEAADKKSQAAEAPAGLVTTTADSQFVAMRRLTEKQYRNSIADILGPDIIVGGRFEPIVRPAHELIAAGARDASISPSGLEQFDAMARVIATQVFDEKHRAQFVPCAPADQAAADAQCASAALTPLGRLLFRRPLSTAEQAFYVKLASDAAKPTGSFYKGLELSLAAMLVSPKFLYIIESAEPDPANPGQLRLDNYSRASRLSYLLWNSTPNENLLKAAEEGRLTDQQQLNTMAAAMVKSPRLEQGVRAFFSDMLLFEKFDELAKDSVVYPYFNQDVGQALPEQMLRTIVDHLVIRGGSYPALFTTNRTFMTRALGAVYQVPVTKSYGWEPYEFGPQDGRAGLVSQAGFLALYSHSGRSSPTLRGRAVRELLMCQPVPNPPGNVNFTAVQDTTNKAMPTARIRLTQHNDDPVCSGCHSITDPIGLTLERFDGIGQMRMTENGAPIDVGGTMDGKTFQGSPGLGAALAANPQTTQCVAGRALEYATGRMSDEESGMIEGLHKSFAAQGYGIRALFLQVATMPEAYQVKTGEIAPTKVTMNRIIKTAR